jgi:adenine-specific DNA-methyltransferase
MTFKEMLPTLWMKAGAIGKCPELEGASIPNMLILPENKMAVLVNENFFAMFAEELTQHPEIQTVFLATDYDINYRSMVKNLNVQNTYQLYRDYLDHFRLNRGRT